MPFGAASQLISGSNQIVSATSFTELARDAREAERRNRLTAAEEPQVGHAARLLAGRMPVIAATDYVRALPQMIAPYLDAHLVALGTDGFGRSDTRTALRAFFEVDAPSIALAAIEVLVREGHVDRAVLVRALAELGANPDAPAPWTV